MSLECLLDLTATPPAPEALYTRHDFPAPPAERPYIFINMVATVDGKIIVGEPGGTAKGVGGPTDQNLFRRLQKLPDAALIGSATLRASNVIYPPDKKRYVVTHTGDIPLDNRFFTDAPERAYVLAPEDMDATTLARLRAGTNVMTVGKGNVALTDAVRRIRHEHDVQYLLCEGGPTLNDDMIRAGLADELFLTIAPKLKGGAHLPTIVTGTGFSSGEFLPLQLLSLYHDAGELYLRYRLGDHTRKVRG